MSQRFGLQADIGVAIANDDGEILGTLCAMGCEQQSAPAGPNIARQIRALAKAGVFFGWNLVAGIAGCTALLYTCALEPYQVICPPALEPIQTREQLVFAHGTPPGVLVLVIPLPRYARCSAASVRGMSGSSGIIHHPCQ